MRISQADLDRLVRQVERSGGKVLRTMLPDDSASGDSPGPSRQEFTIEGWRPPSLNTLMRGKISDRIRLGKAARERIAWEARLADVRGTVSIRRRVSLAITLSGRQRATDIDSMWKATLDGLVSAGLIVDDSARWCAIGDLSFGRGEATSTRIILEDMEES
jgi:hypothetical protein